MHASSWVLERRLGLLQLTHAYTQHAIRCQDGALYARRKDNRTYVHGAERLESSEVFELSFLNRSAAIQRFRLCPDSPEFCPRVVNDQVRSKSATAIPSCELVAMWHVSYSIIRRCCCPQMKLPCIAARNFKRKQSGQFDEAARALSKSGPSQAGPGFCTDACHSLSTCDVVDSTSTLQRGVRCFSTCCDSALSLKEFPVLHLTFDVWCGTRMIPEVQESPSTSVTSLLGGHVHP